MSWLRPFMNLRLSRHCALDVYVSVGIAPLTFIQTGVTLVESAHNDSVSRVGTTCPLDVYPKYRGIVTQFTSDGSDAGDGHIVL